jgi:hypothetical protein
MEESLFLKEFVIKVSIFGKTVELCVKRRNWDAEQDSYRMKLTKLGDFFGSVSPSTDKETKQVPKWREE